MREREHCLHMVKYVQPNQRVCCYCGQRQTARPSQPPGHGPHAPQGEHYVWEPAMANRECPGRLEPVVAMAGAR